MKDLYTFDHSVEEALKTYDLVRGAYTRLFDELKLPYLTAAADSGNMGGSLSHEFHFSSAKGEDTVVSCSNCDSVYNEELADGKAHSASAESDSAAGFDTEAAPVSPGARVSTGLWMAISKDKRTLLRGWYPHFTMQNGTTEPVQREVNSHAVKAIASAAGIELDIGVENPLEQWAAHVKASKAPSADSTERPQVLDLYDSLVRAYKRPPLSDLLQEADCAAEDLDYLRLDTFPGTNQGLNLVKVHDGDQCPKCTQGALKSHTAVELGHTFHLGTRYSDVLAASVMIDGGATVPMQMGCHGIGVSRMITAVADCLADSKGLNWPRVLAPFEVIVVPTKGLEAEAEKIYDEITSDKASPIDAILDDRDKQMGWKLGDADLIGYPVIVVVGKGWKKQRTVEVQCRRLGMRQDVALEELSSVVQDILRQL
jgi:prolyl-tRNA synthetase